MHTATWAGAVLGSEAATGQVQDILTHRLFTVVINFYE